jgi:hypothetical protein
MKPNLVLNYVDYNYLWKWLRSKVLEMERIHLKTELKIPSIFFKSVRTETNVDRFKVWVKLFGQIEVKF